MDPQLEEPELRSYLAVIARRRWFVVITMLVFVGVALAWSLIPAPRYRVRAQVLTAGVNDPVALIFGGNNSGDLDRQAASQLAFLTSSDMRFEVAQAYNGSLDDGTVFDVTARPIQTSQNQNVTSSVVELSLVSSDPEEAATLLNVYANTYVQVRQNKDAERLIGITDMLREQLDAVTDQIEEVRRPIAELEDQLANGTPAEREAAAAQIESLRQERAPQIDALQAQAGELRAQLNDVQFGIELASAGNAQVLSSAGVPDAPISPNLPLNLAIAVVFGLFLGAALAFVRDYFDDSVKSKEVVDQVTGVATLGLIPKYQGESELVTVSQPSAPAAEAFRSLRTAVKFLGVDREVRVVQVTSPSPAEGKTFTSVNLAVTFAQAGDRVVIVGGDLRRPRMEEILGVPLTPGLTGVLIGDVTLPQAIQTVPAVSNLSVLPAGSPPPNPSELLSGERARRLIDVLGQTYDMVVIDCPPVLPVTDSLVLARMVDITLLVTSANKTSKRGLARAVEMLRQVDAPLAGTVLNSLSPDATFSTAPYRYETVTPIQRNGRRRDGGSYGPPPPMAPTGAADSAEWQPFPPGRPN
ncbi:MAG TPA: polysaccharide biosynthesis tyrosine autokinase [Acidimicrobiales bacterium]